MVPTDAEFPLNRNPQDIRECAGRPGKGDEDNVGGRLARGVAVVQGVAGEANNKLASRIASGPDGPAVKLVIKWDNNTRIAICRPRLFLGGTALASPPESHTHHKHKDKHPQTHAYMWRVTGITVAQSRRHSPSRVCTLPNLQSRDLTHRRAKRTMPPLLLHNVVVVVGVGVDIVTLVVVAITGLASGVTSVSLMCREKLSQALRSASVRYPRLPPIQPGDFVLRPHTRVPP